MPAETLAKIIEEGKRLPLGNDEEAFNTRGAWFSVYGPRLLAVAEAAVECERNPWGGGFTALQQALASHAPGAGEEGEK